MSDRTLLLYDERMTRHDPGGGHPERPARLSAIVESLRERPVEGVDWRLPEMASREAVERVHTAGLTSTLERVRGEHVRLDPDTAMSPDSLDAAYLAAGAAIDAARAVVTGAASSAVALVRPPGHHAERQRPMGFCLFNNIAVAAEAARAEMGVERVLIIDWDVHHGNGTQHHFEDRRDVLFWSSHRYPFYPGSGALEETGRGAGAGFTVNAPMDAGAPDADYALLYREILTPVAEQFEPDLVLVSAGYDAHRLDPLGGMRMSDEGFAAVCGVAKDIADRCAGGRLALILEGGYDLEALSEGVRTCLGVLRGETPPDIAGPTPRGDRLASRLRRELGGHWSL